MPTSCCAVNCTTRHVTGSGIGFFSIPAKEEKRKQWIHAISREGWKAKPSDRICGKHFVSGSPSDDPNDVDFVPTIFNDSKKRKDPVVNKERKERAAKREKIKEEEENVFTAAEALMEIGISSSQHIELEAQTEENHFIAENKALEEKHSQLQKEIIMISMEMNSKPKVSYSESILALIRCNKKKTKFYTGLPAYSVFLALLTILRPSITLARQGNPESPSVLGRKFKLSLEEEFFAVLMHLRLGLLLEDVADRFGISVSLASSIFTTWISVMATKLKQLFPWSFFLRTYMVKLHTPTNSRRYPNTRVILDCTEIFIQRSS